MCHVVNKKFTNPLVGFLSKFDLLKQLRYFKDQK